VPDLQFCIWLHLAARFDTAKHRHNSALHTRSMGSLSELCDWDVLWASLPSSSSISLCQIQGNGKSLINLYCRVFKLQCSCWWLEMFSFLNAHACTCLGQHFTFHLWRVTFNRTWASPFSWWRLNACCSMAVMIRFCTQMDLCMPLSEHTVMVILIMTP
jgi:hypothetical protein